MSTASRFVTSILFCLVCAIVWPSAYAAQNFRTQLLNDIVPGSGDSFPDQFVEVNGTIFFTAFTPATGPELWKTDGTPMGTVLVKDINPGNIGSFPDSLTKVGNSLFFSADDGIHGRELWKSDGTPDGTVLVKDIFASSGDSSPEFIFDFNGTAVFVATDGATGRELWKSDGTESGTVLVKDIASGSPNGFGFTTPWFTIFNSKLYFVASGPFGNELWVSNDLTDPNTTQVFDINPSVGDSNPKFLTVVGSNLFFSADDGFNGREIWKHDGTNTTMVADLNPMSGVGAPGPLVHFNGMIYFVGDNGSTGAELFRTDGTAPVLVKDVRSGSLGGLNITFDFTVMNGQLFFAANDGSNGIELWKSDGTETGTVLVKDISVGPSSTSFGSFAVLQNTLFFAANLQLWMSDGSFDGTVPVLDLANAPVDIDSDNQILKVGNGRLYFAGDTSSFGIEPFVTSPLFDLNVVNGMGTGLYASGDIVPIAASLPPPKQRFDGWSGNTAIISDPTAPLTTVIMPAANTFVTATYALFTPSDPNNRLVAFFTVDNAAAFDTVTVNFDGSSSKPASEIVNYSWDFGDGNSEVTTNPTTSHMYNLPGIYLASLIVSNASFESSQTFIRPIFVANRSVDDTQLFVDKFSFTINPLKDNADSLRIAGFVNPAGLPKNLNQITAIVKINGFTIEGGTFVLKLDGTFTFTAKNQNLSEILSIPQTSGSFTLRSQISVQLIDGSRMDVSASNAVDSTGTIGSNGKAKATGSMIPRPGVDSPGGLVNAPRFLATEQTAGHRFNANGNIKASLNGPLVPTGDVTITVGGSMASIVIPAAAFDVKGSGLGTKIKYNKKKLLVDALRKLTIDTKKARYSLQTNELPGTGIPAIGDPDTSFLLTLIFEIPTAEGDFTFQTMLEMQRKSSTSSKWTNRK